MTLKLDRLPDREVKRISFTASPDLKAALDDYAILYERVHGRKEGVAELIPFMLEAFLATDHGFKRVPA